MKKLSLVLLSIGLCYIDTARADLAIVDQSSDHSGNIVVGPTVSIGQGFGQTFTPNLAVINAADVFLECNGTSSTVQLDLFGGLTYSPLSLVASTPPITFSAHPFQMLEFVFATPVTIVPHAFYTFRVTLLSGSSYSPESATLPYTGGTAHNPDGSNINAVDLAFAEGVAVPEPSMWLLLGVGLALLVRFCKRSEQSKRGCERS
jgi:hypothetical protein